MQVSFLFFKIKIQIKIQMDLFIFIYFLMQFQGYGNSIDQVINLLWPPEILLFIGSTLAGFVNQCIKCEAPIRDE